MFSKIIDVTDENHSEKLSDRVYMSFINLFYHVWMTPAQNFCAMRKDTVKYDKDIYEAMDKMDSWYPRTCEDGVFQYDVSKFKKGWNRKF